MIQNTIKFCNIQFQNKFIVNGTAITARGKSKHR